MIKWFRGTGFKKYKAVILVIVLTGFLKNIYGNSIWVLREIL